MSIPPAPGAVAGGMPAAAGLEVVNEIDARAREISTDLGCTPSLRSAVLFKRFGVRQTRRSWREETEAALEH